MKIGSIVELINDNWSKRVNYKNMPFKGKLYEVAGFTKGRKGLGIYIKERQEIINVTKDGISSHYDFPSFLKRRFKEVQPPMEISIESILEQELVS